MAILYGFAIIVGEIIAIINDLEREFVNEFSGKVGLIVLGIYTGIFWAHSLIVALIKGIAAMGNEEV